MIRPSRRDALAASLFAAVTGAPRMAEARTSPDAELVQACAALIRSLEAFEDSELDSDVCPHWRAAEQLRRRIAQLPTHTMEGAVAVAKVASYLAQQPGQENFDTSLTGHWPGRVVNDLLRLHAAGGAA